MKVDSSIEVCEGEEISLGCDVYAPANDAIVRWIGPNDFKSDKEYPVLEKTKPEMSGMYYVHVNNKDFSDTDSMLVTIHPRPRVKIEADGPLVFCQGEIRKLTASPIEDGNKYIWSTGKTSPEIEVKESGIYYLTIENEFGCTGSDTVEIEVVENLYIDISGEEYFCEGETVVLEVKQQDDSYSYEWSNGETDAQIEVSVGGVYIVKVTNEAGCSGIDSILVTMRPKPIAEIIGETKICEGSETSLSSIEGFKEYHWSNGETTKEITVNEPGEYELIVVNEFGCSDTTRVKVEYYPNPNPNILAPESICEGEEVHISSDEDFVLYEWSNGENAKEITITEAGEYWLKVSDENGCIGYDTVYIESIDMDISIDKNEIIYGYIWVAESGDDEIIINNNNDFAIEYEISQIKDVFGLEGYTGIINPNDSETLSIKFTPDDIVDYYDTLRIIVLSPCKQEFAVNLSGNGKAKMIVSIPDTSVKVGSDICIPINARLEIAGIRTSGNFSIEIDMDAEVMNTDVQGIFKNGKRIITASESNLTISDNVIKITEICGKALMGLEDVSEITIDNFEWTDNHIEVETIDGSLTFEGICVRNMSRVQSFKPSKMSISPNPSSDKINVKISSGEKGLFELLIYNMQGVEVYKTLWASNDFSEKAIQINSSDFSGGLYQAVLRSPTDCLFEKVLVVE